MSPYKWRPSNYLCPDCERRLQAKAGPDGLKAERCPDCDWSKVFDPNADEFPSQELDRVRFATDGGRSDTAVAHVDPDADRCPWCNSVRKWKGRHAAAKHPEKWEAFKDYFEQNWKNEWVEP